MNDKLILPPKRVPKERTGATVFLAGTIEMGNSIDWQKEASDLFAANETVQYVFNPRRVDWDSSWTQSIEHPQFNEQVNWELDHISQADVVFFYFDPTSKSPITLMELGYVLSSLERFSGQHVVVCCPDGFWRKGNVDIMCQRAGVSVHTSLGAALLSTNHLMRKDAKQHKEYKLNWDACERIADQPLVHESLKGFMEDHTGDNATCIVRDVAEQVIDVLHARTQL